MSTCPECGDDHADVAARLAQHTAKAKWFGRKIKQWYFIIGFNAFVIMTWSPENVWERLMPLLSCAALVMAGYWVHHAVTWRNWHRVRAWELENRTVMEAAQEAGFITNTEEAIRFVMENPPPGTKPEEWRKGGEKALREYKKREGEGG